MDSPSQILARALKQYSEVDDFDKWPYTIGVQPDSGDSVTLYDDGGKIQKKTARGLLIRQPGVQIRIKGTKYERAWDKMNTIFGWLSEVRDLEVMVDESCYLIRNVQIISGPHYLGFTNKKMFEFTLNVIVMVTTA